jgi:hypothetical protein
MEADNAGFEILRSTDAVSYELIASYKTNNELIWPGQSAFGKDYRFTDKYHLLSGQTYYYKLVEKLPAGAYILQLKTPAGNDLRRFVIAGK